MKTFLLRFFTWWNGQTFGTQVWTRLYGEFVGEDEFGNRYYRTKGGKIDPTLGFERRWVIYNGVAEASRVPPSWHGWLHHTVDVPPTQDKTRTAPLGEAAPAQSDRHAGRPSPERIDLGARPPSQGDGRLQGLEPRQSVIRHRIGSDPWFLTSIPEMSDPWFCRIRHVNRG